MATLRDVAVRALSIGPLTVAQLVEAIQVLAPSVIVWDEGVRHMLEQGDGLFRCADGERWSLSKTASQDPTPAHMERFEDIAARDNDTATPINRLGFIGEDATEYVRHIVLATQPHTVHEQRELAQRRDLALAVGDSLGAAQMCWTLSWGSMRLGMWIADKFRPRGMEACDLILASAQGLYRAAEKWDPSLGAFSTYATWWARQSVLRYLAEHSRLIQIPVHAHDAWLSIRKFVTEYETKHDDEPTAGTISKRLELPRALVDGVLLASGDPIDIDLVLEALDVVDAWNESPGVVAHQERFWNHSMTLEEARSFLRGLDIAEVNEEPEVAWANQSMVSEAFELLDDRSQEIVRRRFGFSDYNEQTLEEIGDLLGLTRERIRQLEAKALDRMAPLLSKLLERQRPKPKQKPKRPKNDPSAGKVLAG